MCGRIHDVGEPDVRHSHQTFQIKGPPHPSTPHSNPPSISSPLTIKSLCTFTHAHTLHIHTKTLISSCFFSKWVAEKAHLRRFVTAAHSLRMQNTPLRRKTRHCGLSYLMWRRVVNVICMLHWCSNCIFFSPTLPSAGEDCDCMVGVQTSVSDDISIGPVWLFFGWDALFFSFFFLDNRQPAYIDPSPGPSSHHHHPTLVCRFLDSESVVLFGPCDFHDHGITHRYEELTFIWLEFCFWEKQDAFV